MKKNKYGPRLGEIFKYVIEQELLKDEHFDVYHRQAEIRALDRKFIESIEQMERLGVKSMKIDDFPVEVKDEDYIPGYAEKVANSVRQVRNHYAHGSAILHNQVLGTFQTACDIINQIYKK